jgi:hypothetical protein
MLEREWVCCKQAIACQFGYSSSHVATVNYVIEVCLYPRRLPSSVRSPLLSPDLYLRTVHLVPHRLSRVEPTFCGHEEHEREQPVLRTRLSSRACLRLLCVCTGSLGIAPRVSPHPCPWAQCCRRQRQNRSKLATSVRRDPCVLDYVFTYLVCRDVVSCLREDTAHLVT